VNSDTAGQVLLTSARGAASDTPRPDDACMLRVD